jgi:hypothetical protein
VLYIIILPKRLIKTNKEITLNSSINLGDLYIIDFWSSDDLGARTTFYDYIDEEFEEDDDKDWIKLNNNVFIDIEGIPYSIFI